MVNWIYGLFLDLSLFLAGLSVVNAYFVFRYRKQISSDIFQKLLMSLVVMLIAANILQYLVPAGINFRLSLWGLIGNFILTILFYFFWCWKISRKNPDELFEKILFAPPAIVVIMIIIAGMYKTPFMFIPVQQ